MKPKPHKVHYLKENNLLQVPLFKFSRSTCKHTETQWTNQGTDYSLICNCAYGVPGSFEQDVYAACMKIWLDRNRPLVIELSYSDIARELGLNPTSWNAKVKSAIIKLANARYEFKQCWIDKTGTGDKTTVFSLFETASIFHWQKGMSKKNSKIRLWLPKQVMKNIEAKYYQLLDMVWYRALPEGLPRRLYEFLEKKQHLLNNGEYRIGEKKLALWLPVTDKNVTNRRKTIEKAVNALKDAGYLLGYERDGNKVWHFYHSEGKHGRKTAPLGDGTDSDTNRTGPVEDCNNRDGVRAEVAEWLYSIPYFAPERVNEILESTTVKEYRHIRKEYEKRASGGNRPGPGWVYAAFMEGWNFFGRESSVTEVYRAFCSWPQERQNELMMKHKDVLKDKDRQGFMEAIVEIIEDERS